MKIDAHRGLTPTPRADQPDLSRRAAAEPTAEPTATKDATFEPAAGGRDVFEPGATGTASRAPSTADFHALLKRLAAGDGWTPAQTLRLRHLLDEKLRNPGIQARARRIFPEQSVQMLVDLLLDILFGRTEGVPENVIDRLLKLLEILVGKSDGASKKEDEDDWLRRLLERPDNRRDPTLLSSHPKEVQPIRTVVGGPVGPQSASRGGSGPAPTGSKTAAGAPLPPAVLRRLEAGTVQPEDLAGLTDPQKAHLFRRLANGTDVQKKNLRELALKMPNIGRVLRDLDDRTLGGLLAKILTLIGAKFAGRSAQQIASSPDLKKDAEAYKRILDTLPRADRNAALAGALAKPTSAAAAAARHYLGANPARTAELLGTMTPGQARRAFMALTTEQRRALMNELGKKGNETMARKVLRTLGEGLQGAGSEKAAGRQAVAEAMKGMDRAALGRLVGAVATDPLDQYAKKPNPARALVVAGALAHCGNDGTWMAQILAHYVPRAQLEAVRRMVREEARDDVRTAFTRQMDKEPGGLRGPQYDALQAVRRNDLTAFLDIVKKLTPRELAAVIRILADDGQLDDLLRKLSPNGVGSSRIDVSDRDRVAFLDVVKRHRDELGPDVRAALLRAMLDNARTVGVDDTATFRRQLLDVLGRGPKAGRALGELAKDSVALETLMSQMAQSGDGVTGFIEFLRSANLDGTTLARVVRALGWAVSQELAKTGRGTALGNILKGLTVSVSPDKEGRAGVSWSPEHFLSYLAAQGKAELAAKLRPLFLALAQKLRRGDANFKGAFAKELRAILSSLRSVSGS